MKKFQRILATVVALAIVLLLPAQLFAENEANEALNIAIVTSPSGVDDGSFNQDNYEGVLAFLENYPDAKVQTVRELDVNNSIPAVESIVADYDVVVVPGFQFAGIGQIAIDNPDKKFILVDSFPTVDGEEQAVDNIYAMYFAEEESGFFAGVAAALESDSDKVAVVNGIAYPSNVNYQFGFEAGVAYANKHFDTEVEIVEIAGKSGTDVRGIDVGGNYVGTFDDEAAGKQLAEDLLAEGVDVIFVAAGGSGNGVFTAVKEHGDAYVIGCDVDQYDDGAHGDDNVVLTSALKVMHLNVERQLTAIAEGEFEGGNFTLGADSDSTGIVTEDDRQQLDDDTIEVLEQIYELVKDGTIDPPNNFSETTIEDFVGLDVELDDIDD